MGKVVQWKQESSLGLNARDNIRPSTKLLQNVWVIYQFVVVD